MSRSPIVPSVRLRFMIPIGMYETETLALFVPRGRCRVGLTGCAFDFRAATGPDGFRLSRPAVGCKLHAWSLGLRTGDTGDWLYSRGWKPHSTPCLGAN